MSKPNSLNVGPFTSNVLIRKRYLILYFLIIWATFYTIQIEIWIYWKLLYFGINFLIFLPLLFLSIYFSMIMVSLIYTKILLVILNLFHKPREGVYLRNLSDRNYRYWSLRNVLKKWPIWLSHRFPFPFLDNLCFKFFGVKTKFKNSLFEGWVDCEFIEFGKNVVIGQASIIQSSVIVGNLLIIKKTIINDNVSIGAHSIVMPGTHIGKNVILAASSTTHVDQKLEEGWIYLGVPAKKYKENRYHEDNLEKAMMESIKDADELRKMYELLYLKRHDESFSIIEKRQKRKEALEEEHRRLMEGGKKTIKSS